MLPDGTYVPPPHAKVNYGTMMFSRAIIVNACGKLLSGGVVIATRYSAVRRQSEIVPGYVEYIYI